MKRAFLILIFLLGCAEKERNAKWYLENGFYRISSELYEEEVKKNPDDCSAQYGLFLSKFLFFLYSVISSGSGSGPWISAFLPQEYGDLDTVVETNFIPVKKDFIVPVLSSAQNVIEKNCSFYTENGIEFTLSVVPERKIWIGKKFNRKEAFFIRGLMGFINAFISFISAHDLSMDYPLLLKNLDADYIRDKISNDIIGLVRKLAIVMETSPEFLDWKEERKSLFNDTSPSIRGGLEDLASWIEEVFFARNGDEDDFFSYIDRNRNGTVDKGDEIRIGIMRYYSEEGEDFPFFKLPVKISSNDMFGLFFFSLGEDYLKNTVLFLRDLSRAISEGKIINISEFNKIIPFGVSFFPDTISINFKRLLPENCEEAIPLRNMLPLWKKIKGETVFLVEGELGRSADKSMEIGEDFCWTCLPGSHFSSEVYEVEEIPDDCLSIKEPYFEIGKIKIPLIYIYWQDPTFNNSLYVDLSSINNCLPDKNYSGSNIPPSQYSINKALNHLFRNTMSLLSALQFQ